MVCLVVMSFARSCNRLHFSHPLQQFDEEMEDNPSLVDVAWSQTDFLCAQAQLMPSTRGCNVYFC